jgi:hypothetical protein
VNGGRGRPRRTWPGAAYLFSSLAYNIGSGCYAVALGQSLFEQTNSPSAFVVVLVVEYLMPVVLGVSAGSLVDRGDPARVAAIVCGLTSVAVGAYAVLLDGSVVIGIALGILVNLVRPFYRVAIFTLGPLTLAGTELRRYNARWIASVQAGQILGGALAGLVLWIAPVAVAFPVAAAAFALSAASFLVGRATLGMALRRRDETGAGAARSRRGWGATLRKLLHNRSGQVALLLIGVDFITIAVFTALLAPLVANLFGGRAGWIGILDALFAVGAIVGAVFCDRLTARLDVNHAASLGYAGQVLGLAGLAGSVPLGPTRTSSLLTCAAALLIGAGVAISSSQQLTVLQGLASAGETGKIGAIRQGAIGLTTAVTLPLVGLLATYSLGVAYAATAALLATALCANQLRSRLPRLPADAGALGGPAAVGRARVPGPVRVVGGVGWSVYASTHSYAIGMMLPDLATPRVATYRGGGRVDSAGLDRLRRGYG